MNKSRRMANAVLSVSAVIFLSKILGLIKQMVTANAFGASFQTDVISLAQGLITNFEYAITQALITAFIPTYIHLKTKGERNEDKFFCNTCIVFFVFSALISVVFLAFSNYFARIMPKVKNVPGHSSSVCERLWRQQCRVFRSHFGSLILSNHKSA